MHNQKFITQAYSLGHNSVLPNKITILTSHFFSQSLPQCRQVWWILRRIFPQHPKGRKSREIGFPATKILEVTFPVKQFYGMSYILRPSNSLVTTSCRLDPFSSRGANPATKGTLSDTAIPQDWLQSWSPFERASTLGMTSSQCHKRHQIKHTSGMSTSHTPHQVSEA